MPGAGIEPAHPYEREILSLLCLPVSPPGRMIVLLNHYQAAGSFAVRILTLGRKIGSLFCLILAINNGNIRLTANTYIVPALNSRIN